jgi:hypothetical protein
MLAAVQNILPSRLISKNVSNKIIIQNLNYYSWFCMDIKLGFLHQVNNAERGVREQGAEENILT